MLWSQNSDCRLQWNYQLSLSSLPSHSQSERQLSCCWDGHTVLHKSILKR